MLTRTVAILSFVALGMGCVESEPSKIKQPLVIGSANPVVSQAAEAEGKRLWATPSGPFRGTFTDPKLPTIALTDFNDGSQQRAAKADIPILVPNIPALIPTAVITGGSGWFAVSMQDTDYGVYLRGSILEFRDPTLPEVQIDTWVSRTHGISTVHFRRDGISFNLDIECKSPEKDPRCADEATSLAFADDLLKVIK